MYLISLNIYDFDNLIITVVNNLRRRGSAFLITRATPTASTPACSLSYVCTSISSARTDDVAVVRHVFKPKLRSYRVYVYATYFHCTFRANDTRRT